MGWNGITAWKKSSLFASLPVSTEEAKVYFVHSFRVIKTDKNAGWVLTTTNYGDLEFVSAVQKGNVMATQFHPEKSGVVGIAILKGFLENTALADHDTPSPRRPRLPVRRCRSVSSRTSGDFGLGYCGAKVLY